MNLNGYFFGSRGDVIPAKMVNIKTLDWLWLWAEENGGLGAKKERKSYIQSIAGGRRGEQNQSNITLGKQFENKSMRVKN